MLGVQVKQQHYLKEYPKHVRIYLRTDKES